MSSITTVNDTAIIWSELTDAQTWPVGSQVLLMWYPCEGCENVYMVERRWDPSWFPPQQTYFKLLALPDRYEFQMQSLPAVRYRNRVRRYSRYAMTLCAIIIGVMIACFPFTVIGQSTGENLRLEQRTWNFAYSEMMPLTIPAGVILAMSGVLMSHLIVAKVFGKDINERGAWALYDDRDQLVNATAKRPIKPHDKDYVYLREVQMTGD